MDKIGNFELNRIYCIDCLKAMKQMPDECVDLIVTDPPYNTGMTKKETKSSKKPWLFGFFNDSYSEWEYLKLVRDSCIEWYRLLKKDKGGYLFINWKQLGLWINELSQAGFKVKNVIVWDKVVHGLNYQNYAYTYELIVFFAKGDFYPNNKRNAEYRDLWRIQRDINNDNKEEHHETVKQIRVARRPIRHGSNYGELVLDPFMGTGTTAVACKQLKRNFIGFEIDKNYCEVAERRLSQENLKTFFPMEKDHKLQQYTNPIT